MCVSMYLRSTKRKNKDGSTVEYYQLAHNERHPQTRKPVAKIIHNFGRADQLDRQELVRLCHSIARVCGLIVTDPCDESAASSKNESFGLGENLTIRQTLALGCPMVIEALWERLGLKKTLEGLQRTPAQKFPTSGPCWPWWPTGSAIPSPNSVSGTAGCRQLIFPHAKI